MAKARVGAAAPPPPPRRGRAADLATIAIAVTVHAGLAVAIAKGMARPATRPHPRPLEVDFRHHQPQAAATPAPPPREAPPRSRRKLAMRPRTQPAPATPPPVAPPRAAPPPATPPPPTAPARPVYGVAMDSTTSAPGAPAVAVGGTSLADPSAGGKARGRTGGAADGEGDGPGFAPVSELQIATMPDVDADACGKTVSYPPDAEREGIEGDVRLRIALDAAGHVHSVRVLSGLGHGLDQAATEALKHRCRFKPAIDRSGKPVAFVIESYTFHFELPR